MLFSLFAVALAEPAGNEDVACAIATLSETAPADGATGVPLDIAPTLLYTDGCDIGGLQTVSLFAAGVLVGESTHDWEDIVYMGSSIMIEPDFGEAELEPDTEYSMVVEGEWSGSHTIVFTTGDAVAPAFPEDVLPQITLDRVEAEANQWGTSMFVDLTFTPASEQPGLFRVQVSDEYIVDGGVHSGSAVPVSVQLFSEDEGPACLTVFERDARGIWHEGEEQCREPDVRTGHGCSTAPGVLGLFGFLPLLMLRRRKSETFSG